MENEGDSGNYSVLECVSRDLAVKDWFLRLLPEIFENGPDPYSPDYLDLHLVRLGELFRKIDGGGRRSLVGLWCELFLIAIGCDSPARLVRAWHAGSGVTHDFWEDGWYVEVKGSETGLRRHHFSSRQLEPVGRVLVASVVLEPSEGGDSLLDLHSRVVDRLADDVELQQKVHEEVISHVGRRVPEAVEVRFDSEVALSNLRFFRASDVPRVAAPFPFGVSDVRFVSDLSSSQPVLSGERAESPLWSLFRDM
jgi:hypothetical protein